MSGSAFQLLKNNPRSNSLKTSQETPIIDYGRIIKVIDIQTVVVETIIKTSLSKAVYTVTLLNLSSALLEINSCPKIGDTVLLLFLQKHDPRLFIHGQETIVNSKASGYNKFSGVGILMSTVKGVANTAIHFFEEEKPTAEINSFANWRGAFNAEAAVTFCRAVQNSGDEALISLTFGEGRPYTARFLSAMTEEHGFWKDWENNLIELSAAVTKRYSVYAPITKDIQVPQTVDVGLGLDKNDKPVETEAPITETVHSKAPIAKVIRSPQDIKIGIGNAESESDDEQRDAPVTIELGEKADISFKTKSGIAFEAEKKGVDILLGENADIFLASGAGRAEEFDKAVTLKSKESIALEIKTAEKFEIKNASESLGAVLSDFIQAVHDAVVHGSPTTQKMNPATKTALLALKTRTEALMET